MSFLLLYVGEGQKFDGKRIADSLQNSPNTVSFATGTHGTLFQWEYHADNDFTKIRLKDDLETIVIEGMGYASLRAALEIQRGYEEPIHLINEGYTFDLILSECESLDDLLHRIEKAEE